MELATDFIFRERMLGLPSLLAHDKLALFEVCLPPSLAHCIFARTFYPKAEIVLAQPGKKEE